MSRPFRRSSVTRRCATARAAKCTKAGAMPSSFNEAAGRAGASVMRWMYMGTNPEHNVNFGLEYARRGRAPAADTLERLRFLCNLLRT